MRLGIVLVDVSINDSFLIEGDLDSLTTVKLQVRPFQGGYENLDCGTSFIESGLSESGAEGRSLLEDLIFYWGNREPPGFDVNRPTLVSLSFLPLKVVAAEWMMYLEVMFHSTKQHEYPPNSVPAASRQISLLNTDLSTLQAWARRSMATSSKIHDVIRLLEHQRSQDHDIQCCTLLIEDYEYIASRVDTYSHRLEAMVPTVTSLIQIFDSQQSLKETANIARLTYLALVFMPLTFFSGLLSMNDRIVSGSQIFWLYLAVAIPVCTMVFFVARPPRRILDFLSMWTWKRSRPSDEVSAKEETNKP